MNSVEKKELAELVRGEGEYVCHHCHIIYCYYGSSLRCDLCNRKLRWASTEKLQELEAKWQKWEQRRGLTCDFAYQKQRL